MNCPTTIVFYFKPIEEILHNLPWDSRKRKLREATSVACSKSQGFLFEQTTGEFMKRSSSKKPPSNKKSNQQNDFMNQLSSKEDTEFSESERMLNSRYSDPEKLRTLRELYERNGYTEGVRAYAEAAIGLQRMQVRSLMPDVKSIDVEFIIKVGIGLVELFKFYPEFDLELNQTIHALDESQIVLLPLCIIYRGLKEMPDDVVESAIDMVDEFLEHEDDDFLSGFDMREAVRDVCLFDYDLEMLLLKNRITING